MSKPVYEGNLKSPLKMAKLKNLQILPHERGSQSHNEILETAIEDSFIWEILLPLLAQNGPRSAFLFVYCFFTATTFVAIYVVKSVMMMMVMIIINQSIKHWVVLKVLQSSEHSG